MGIIAIVFKKIIAKIPLYHGPGGKDWKPFRGMDKAFGTEDSQRTILILGIGLMIIGLFLTITGLANLSIS